MLPACFVDSASEDLDAPTLDRLSVLVNPVTRTNVCLDPPLFRGPQESKDAFVTRMARVSDAFDYLCQELWTFPMCSDITEMTFYKPEWLNVETGRAYKPSAEGDLGPFSPILPVPVDLDNDPAE